MPVPNIICLVVDGLRASALGTYGAAGGDTPAFDRLASESFVFDQAWIDQPDLSQIYRGYWQGLSAILPESAGVKPASLPGWLGEQGYQTLLITDEPVVAEHTLAGEFQDVHLLAPGEEENARDLTQTQFARLFADLLDSLEELQQAPEGEPAFIWLHAQGLFAPWDGPLELRQSLADEEDPPPPESTRVPNDRLDAEYDPDELLGIAQSYAGQVMALDGCLAALLDFLEAEKLESNTAILLLGSRGFPLGEHLRVGLVDEALYGELLHIPCMFRLPAEDCAGFRSAALVLPSDVCLSVAEIAGQEFPEQEQLTGKSLLPLVRSDIEGVRDAILIQGPQGERAIRTSAWHLRWKSNEPGELFVKPDDRWEANEISDRCPEIVTALMLAADQLKTAILKHAVPPVMDGILVEGE